MLFIDSWFSDFPDRTIDDAFNFCRNPNNVAQGPWCVVLDPGGEFYAALCQLPICGMSEADNNIYMSSIRFDHIGMHVETDLKHTMDLINTAAYPVIILRGTVSNILSVSVFTRPALKDSATSLILIILAQFDTLTLILGAFENFLHEITHLISNWKDSDLGCKISIFLFMIVNQMSSMVLVMVTLERVIAVGRPYEAKTICSKANVIICFVLILIFISLLHTPIFLYCKSYYEIIFARDESSFIISYLCGQSSRAPQWIQMFLILLTFLLLLIGNIMIIIFLRNAQKSRQTLAASTNRESNATQLHYVTIMLLSVSFSFLILNLPYLLYSLCIPYMVNWYENGADNEKYTIDKFIWYELSITLTYVNNSINFLIYCIGGRRFRQEFLVMIGCRDSSVNSNMTKMTRTTKLADTKKN